eukprot:185655_1
MQPITNNIESDMRSDSLSDLVPASHEPKFIKKCCNSGKKKLWYSVIAILFIIAFAALIQVFIIPTKTENVAKNRVKDEVIMKEEHLNGSHNRFNSWINNSCIDCAVGYFSYYIYNMTNPEQVLYESALPKFEELGPWVYRRFGHKKNVRFYDDKSGANISRLVTYTNVPSFVFEPQLSTNLDRHDSIIYTINFALLGFFNTLNWIQGNEAFQSILSVWDNLMKTAPIESILYNKTVFKYLHGVNNAMIESVSLPNATFFRLLSLDENTVIEKTGEYNIDNCRELIIYQNVSISENTHPLIKQFIPYVYNRTDAIVATSRETLQFPPFNYIGKNKYENGRLIIWGTEKFRPVNYIFEKEVTHKGLNMNRYKISNEVWLNITDKPENKGYHLNYLPSGLINLTLFRGSPSFLSKGHFKGFPYYQKNVNDKFNIKMIFDNSDIYNNEEEDEQLFDMDPFSGIGFRQYHTYQINFHAITLKRPYNTNYKKANLSFWNDIIPFARVVVRGGASDDKIEDVANAYKQLEFYNNLSLYGGIMIGIVCVGLILLIIYIMISYSNKEVYINEKIHPQISLAERAINTEENGSDSDTKYSL